MRCTASRMVARSTMAGTPVKSCSSTRAGMKAISFSGVAGLPVGQRLNVRRVNEAAVFAAQKIFQQNAQRKGELAQIRDAIFFERFQAMNFKALRAYAQRVTRAKRISCGDGHPLGPFASAWPSMITEIEIWRGRLYWVGVQTIGKIVLISTYELGRQPFGLASPAAWLRKRGHSVVCLDLARQELERGGGARCGSDRHLFADAHGDAVGGAIASCVAGAESTRAFLLLRLVRAHECDVLAKLGRCRQFSAANLKTDWRIWRNACPAIQWQWRAAPRRCKKSL